MKTLPGLMCAVLSLCGLQAQKLDQLTGGAPAVVNTTLTISGNLTARQSGAGATFTATGTGSLTGIGSGALSASGTIDTLDGSTSQTTKGSLTLTFSNTDSLTGTFSIPPGLIFPAVGGSSSTSGTISFTGGTGQYAGATGSFPSVTGSGVATGTATSTFQISGSGTMTLAGPTGPINRIVAHAADGNKFKTTIILTNSDTAQVSYILKFNSESGGAPASRFEL